MSRAHRLAVLALCAVPALRAQGVMIAPHAVFMDQRSRGGAVTLVNPGTEPVEVSIAVFYGYTRTDSLGQLTLHQIDQPDATHPSAAGWIQAFPRRLTVEPQDRQTVRLLATPPPGLADGEYWARLAFTAKAGQVPVTGVSDTARVNVGLTLEVRTIIGLHYRKGAVQTGLAVSGLRAALVGDSVVVHARLERRGNAAYLGTVHGTVVNASRQTVGQLTVPITVFFANEPRWTSAVGALPPGAYSLHLEIVPEREDLPSEVVLSSGVIRDSVPVSPP
ncbi:MAG: fimbrial biogenesis chaperone [Gemmatimonadales bacterium]